MWSCTYSEKSNVTRRVIRDMKKYLLPFDKIKISHDFYKYDNRYEIWGNDKGHISVFPEDLECFGKMVFVLRTFHGSASRLNICEVSPIDKLYITFSVYEHWLTDHLPEHLEDELFEI